MDQLQTIAINKPGERKIFNPFPGLRPFTIDESHLFFGREGQSDEMIYKLSQNRFVAVIGASGSGKSSLMYCGLVPVLHGGFITETGSQWRIITTRPGNSPILNLANSLIQSEKQEYGMDGDEKYLLALIHSTLRTSSKGLVDSLKQLKKTSDQNFLIMVDQFEELFRFKRNRSDSDAFNESLGYVRLLLAAIEQQELPVYIVLTMRSDFIGDCSQFQELTRMINLSHYLIPQMTRDNLYEAITGPVAVGGGKISTHLVQQLLNDVGDNPDQLPILQHSLMRTWDYWERLGNFDEPLDIKHYEDIGKMEKALSMHANEAFDELDIRSKELCEHMFKSLTEKGADNRGIRRPSSVNEIASISQADPEEIIKIVNVFRAPGRSFLTPSAAMTLHQDSVIDISHESLMRIWDKLRFWVDEEANAVHMYLKLAEAAGKYQEGLGSLWRQPDLQIAINWKEKQKPTLSWAQRYHPAFERTLVFLETSEKAYIAEEEIKIKLQKRAMRRTRIFAAVLGTAAIIALGLMIYSFDQSEKANKKTIEASQQRKEAENQKIQAEKQREIAQEQSQEALRQSQLAEEQRKIAESQKREADRQKLVAQNQERLAVSKSKEAEEQRKLAEENARKAQEQERLALEAKDEALNLRMISISQSMAVKSVQINDDKDQKGLLAYQSYHFNTRYRGNTFNPDLFNGIYTALKTLKPSGSYQLNGHVNTIKTISINPVLNEIYSSSSDGLILSWKEKKQENKTIITNNTTQLNRMFCITPDGKWMINAAGTEMQVIDLTGTSYEIKRQNFSSGIIWCLAPAPDSRKIYFAAADQKLREYILAESKVNVIAEGINIKNIVVNHENNILLCITEEGVIVLYDPSNKNKTTYQAFSQGNSLKLSVQTSQNQIPGQVAYPVLIGIYGRNADELITGDKNGNIIIWSLKSENPLNILKQHTARINDIKISPDKKLMATASSDGSVKVWLTADFQNQPLNLKDHEAWAMSLDFSADSKTLYCGYNDGWIQYWPTQVAEMAEQICPLLTRNFSKQEWNIFVASDIPYEKTCLNLPEGN